MSEAGAVVLPFPLTRPAPRRPAALSFSEFIARQPGWHRHNIERWLHLQLLKVPMPFSGMDFHNYLDPYGFSASSLQLLLKLRHTLWIHGFLPQETTQLAKLCRVSERTFRRESYAVAQGFSPVVSGEWSDRFLLRERSKVLKRLERQAMKRFGCQAEGTTAS